MARMNNELQAFVDNPPPTTEVKSLSFLKAPQGLDLASPLSKLDPRYSASMMNLRIEDGTYVPRHGTRLLVNASAANPIMAHAHIVTALGVERVVRWTTTKMQYYNGATWVDIGATTFTGNDSYEHMFSWTVFGNNILFTNNKDGLFRYDPAANTITSIVTAPGGRRVDVFNGRVVVSGVTGQPQRMQWSVKNDDSDWVGTGSGFEDFKSGSGSYADLQMALIPVNDNTALSIRSNSVWAVYETGNVLAPFRPGRRFSNFGSLSPHSLVGLDGAVLGFFRSGFYVITETEKRNIGVTIGPDFKSLIDSAGVELHGRVVGCVDPKLFEYRVIQGPGSSAANRERIWRWHPHHNAWTRDTYLIEIAHIAPIHYVVSALSAPHGLLIASTAAVPRSFYESLTSIVDAMVDGTTGPFAWEIETGYITLHPLHNTRIQEVELELEVKFSDQTIGMTHTQDGGTTGIQYGDLKTVPVNKSALVVFREVYEDRQVQLGLFGLGVGNVLRLIEMVVHCTLGTKENL